MKRIHRFLALTAIFLFLLSGCSNGGKNNIVINNFDPYSDQLCFIRSQGGFPSMVSTESGYYFVGGINGAKYLYFTDIATMKTTVLCNKPDCLHAYEKDPAKRKSCNAFLNDIADTVGDLMYYDSYLYCSRVYWGWEADQAVLTKILLDGTQREDVCTFKVCPQYMIIHRNYLYYQTTDYGTQENMELKSNSGVYRIPMNNLNASPEMVYEYNGYDANIGGLLGYEDAIYFNCYRYLDQKMEKRESELVCYKIDSGKTSVICKNVKRNAICGGKLVYTVDAEHKCVCDLDGSNKQVLEGVIGYTDSDDTYILTDTIAMHYSGAKDKNGNPMPIRLYVYDLNGKELQSFDFSKYSYAYVLGSDSNYIFLITSSLTDENHRDCWRIDKSKIAGGNARMEKFFSYPEYMPLE